MSFHDKIVSNFHRALDLRESDYAVHCLTRWLGGGVRYLSPRRMEEIGCFPRDCTTRNGKFPSAFALYGGMHIPFEKIEALAVLMEYCRCWPEHSQQLIGCESATAWRVYCAAES